MIQGQTDPAILAELAKGRLREKRDLLAQALSGRFQAHHRFMLIQPLSPIDFLEEQIAKLEAELDEQMRPFQAALTRWDQIPGINLRVAPVILARARHACAAGA